MRHATHTISRRLGALLLCLALLAGLLPMSALAAETEGVIYNVKYIDENGEERICKAATVVTSGNRPHHRQRRRPPDPGLAVSTR